MVTVKKGLEEVRLEGTIEQIRTKLENLFGINIDDYEIREIEPNIYELLPRANEKG